MKISIQMISLAPHELFFLFDHEDQPVIEANQVQYRSLGRLLQMFPQLNFSKHLDKLAQIANFLARGLEFQYIEDIESFRLFYYQQMEAEESALLYEGTHLKDYGIFDLSVIHPPRMKEGKLIFFVKHDYLNIPYQTILHYPIGYGGPNMVYELLPLL
ncbi:MAG: hypothetical protein ACH350_04330 [Parachlamydiaceae bacterium]